jgi:hypothetical protein
MIEALGGEDVIKKDARLSNMLWQAENMLGGQIEVQDFIYIMHYTDTTGQQLRQIDCVKRYVYKQEKIREQQMRRVEEKRKQLELKQESLVSSSS